MEIGLLFTSIATAVIWHNALKLFSIPLFVRIVSVFAFLGATITFGGWCFSDYIYMKSHIVVLWYYWIAYLFFAIFNPVAFLLVKQYFRSSRKRSSIAYMKK